MTRKDLSKAFNSTRQTPAIRVHKDCIPRHRKYCTSRHSDIGDKEDNLIVVVTQGLNHSLNRFNDSTGRLQDDGNFCSFSVYRIDCISEVMFRTAANWAECSNDIRIQPILKLFNLSIQLSFNDNSNIFLHLSSPGTKVPNPLQRLRNV